MGLKRQLYLWHRWLGIVACLFMALWFVSGVVMLYVGYPKLTPAERLAHLPALPAGCCAQMPDNWAQQPLKALRLTSLGGRPYYLLDLADGRRVALDAASGKPLAGADAAWALANARQFAGDVALDYQGTLDEDRWTHSRALDGERPLHQVRVADAAGTWLYLSGRTGEVVRDATAQERAWNWVGAWLHWLYPLRGGFGFDNGWRTLVIGLSLLGTLMAVLGMAVGVLRLRLRKRYRSGSCSPYPGGWLRWHHIGGLLFGGVLLLWVFSGLMSMRPWGLTDSRSQIALSALQQGPLRAADLRLSVGAALQRLGEANFTAVELQWQRLGDATYLVARSANGDSRILESDAPPVKAFSRQRLLAAAHAMAPEVASVDEWQDTYDFHYFARDPQSMYGFQTRPLPVLRLRFADAADTWVYLDPASGTLVASHDRAQRAGRWLFNLLHSWDWQPLLARPLLREGLIIALSAGGLVISISGVVLGWRRLRRACHQYRH
ncbi:PepSY domain-containing protein [Pseudomonas sp. GD03858]|uniref:PepSY domain-containing protein n=1 Tax=unclassified Pseudomonas TaxID=196821 RepID=UPI00244D29C8|nr:MULTISPECIES: PepSY domain-containing protein [unclassified Pseudomonas]MDH0648626.1 PepSY domain-containing protein [Pseudomonas sp. GD03867]MDH0664143.1 PepSY domain-containing protein [Pseudomonas sp. GD03858]